MIEGCIYFQRFLVVEYHTLVVLIFFINNPKVIIHLGHALLVVQGFIDITNTLYNIAEVIEFAARLSEKGIYQDSLQIVIHIKNVKDFKLWAKDRFWRGHYPATSNVIAKKIEVNARDILGQAASITLDTTIYILKLFGWDNPPRDILKNDLEKFLIGK